MHSRFIFKFNQNIILIFILFSIKIIYLWNNKKFHFRLNQLNKDDWVLVDADKQPGGLAGSFKDNVKFCTQGLNNCAMKKRRA